MVSKTMNNAAATPTLLSLYNLRWYSPTVYLSIQCLFYYLTNITIWKLYIWFTEHYYGVWLSSSATNREDVDTQKMASGRGCPLHSAKFLSFLDTGELPLHSTTSSSS